MSRASSTKSRSAIEESPPEHALQTPLFDPEDAVAAASAAAAASAQELHHLREAVLGQEVEMGVEGMDPIPSSLEPLGRASLHVAEGGQTVADHATINARGGPARLDDEDEDEEEDVDDSADDTTLTSRDRRTTTKTPNGQRQTHLHDALGMTPMASEEAIATMVVGDRGWATVPCHEDSLNVETHLRDDVPVLLPPLYDGEEDASEAQEHPLTGGAATAAVVSADGASKGRPEVALAVMPVFMVYGALLSLQEKLRSHIGITDNKSPAAETFQQGVSMIFIGDLVFRLMHNVLLTFLRPRGRVFFAFGCVAVSISTLLVVYYVVEAKALWPVFVAYFMGGVGIGTFETNMLSCLTPLGDGAKEWAVKAMPMGYNGIAITAFLVFSAAPTNAALQMGTFVFILAAIGVGAVLWVWRIEDVPFEASEDDAKAFFTGVRYHWREWLPKTWKHLLCFFVNMFGVILMSGVVLYLYKDDEVPLWPSKNAPRIPKNTFQAIYNVCAFLGDLSSRHMAYTFLRRRKMSPAWWLLLLAAGTGLGLCRVAVLAWPGMYLVMYANGSLYAVTTKHIDSVVPRQFNLVVLSVWLFLGDVGSYSASSVTDAVAAFVG